MKPRSPLLLEMDQLLEVPNLFPKTIELIRAAIAAQEKAESSDSDINKPKTERPK